MNYFCYWQAKSLPDTLIVYFNVIVTILIAIFTARSFRNTQRKIRKRVIAIYIGISLWVVTNAVKDIYSLVIYHAYVANGQFQTMHSKTFAVLDSLPAIVVQTLLLTIPYLMWRNVMGILSKMDLQRNLGEEQFLNFYTFYLIIRFVILLLPWIALIIMPVNHSSTANFVKLALQLFDSLICNILLVGSLTAFLKRFAQIRLDSQQDKKKLKWQYAIMVMSSSFRFIIDLGFLVILPLISTSQCISPISQHYLFSIGYTLIGSITMHFIPIGVVLYIYKPKYEHKAINQTEESD